MNILQRLLELRRQMDGLVTEARGVLGTAQGETRDLNETEQARYDELTGRMDGLRSEIQRLEQLLRFSDMVTSNVAGRPDARGNGADDPHRIGMDDEAVRQYSLVRAIRAAVTGDWSNAGLEREASRAVAGQVGREPQGFFVPQDFLAAEQRDLTVGTATAGGNLVATDLLAQSFVELLRNRMVVRQAGATVLTGLVGSVAIPRQTSGATAYWVAESGAPTEGQQAFDQIPMAPKTVGAYTDISRKLLLQASLDVESLVRGDLATVLALAIDLASLHGSGASNQPKGIENATGVNSVTFAAANPTYAEVVQMETEVSTDNADIGRLAYVLNAARRGGLKTTDKSSGSGQFVWEPGNMVNGYNALTTNQATKMFFGNWGDLVIGQWSGLDVLVDPYSNSTTGTVRVVALQDVDIAVRHPEAFCIGSAA